MSDLDKAKRAKALERTIRTFFRLLDERKLDKLPPLFERDCTIIHFDGIITTSEGFLSEMKTDTLPPSSKRELSDFRSDGDGDCAWIAYINRNRIGSRIMTFAETAVMRRREGVWRFAHVHYSMIR
jgi:hypothetical protein